MQFLPRAPSVKSIAFLNACNLSLNKWFVQKKQPENIYFRENFTSYFLKNNFIGFGLERRHMTNATKQFSEPFNS